MTPFKFVNGLDLRPEICALP